MITPLRTFISPAVKALNNPHWLNKLDTPQFQHHAVTGLIVMNGTMRPIATEMDSSASDKEKHYSAAREFLHQSMCLICHYTLSPAFEVVAFHAARQFPGMQKDFKEFENFKQVKEAIKFNVEARRHNRLLDAKLKIGEHIAEKAIPVALSGVLRMGGTIGTILALAVAAPMLNNVILKPILKIFKLEES
jgi:hypothetical protein